MQVNHIAIKAFQQVSAGMSAGALVGYANCQLGVNGSKQIIYHTHVAVTKIVKQALACGGSAHVGNGISRKYDSIH